MHGEAVFTLTLGACTRVLLIINNTDGFEICYSAKLILQEVLPPAPFGTP